MLNSFQQHMKAIFSVVFILFFSGDCVQINLQVGIPQRIIIPPNAISSISVQNVSSDTVFAVIQLHTQWYNLSLSSEPKFYRNTTKTGSNIGLVTLLVQGRTQLTWYVQTGNSSNVTAVAYAQLYTQYDPIPGGCNQVFNLAIDPSVVLSVSSHLTQVWFQWSNLASPPGQLLPDCENKSVINTLSYDVYVAFVKQRDFSEESYLSSIEDMLNPDSIMDNGNSIWVYGVKDSPSSKSYVTVTSERNQGALYAVIVTRQDTNRRAAYVTAVTYACDSDAESCSSKSSVLEIVSAVALSLCGLFLLVLGHSFFKSMMFLFGLTFTSLLAYILLSTPHTMDDSLKLPLSLALGVVGGILWLTYWLFCAFPIISVLVPGMCAGYLVASVLFFTPLGNIWWWDTSLNYAVAFSCVVLTFTVILMAYQKVLSIISCAIVGAFMLLMCLAIPLRSSLRLIFLNSIYHQTEVGYAAVKVVAPFKTQDIALAVLWGVLILAGTGLQFYRSRNQPPFEFPARHRRRTGQWQVPHRFTGTEEDNIVNHENDDERTRLLPRDTGGTTIIRPEPYLAISPVDTKQGERDREGSLST